MAKGVAGALVLCCLLLVGGACAEEIAGGRKLLGKTNTKAKSYFLDWRNKLPMEMNIKLGDTVIFNWKTGTATGIYQLNYPGLCAGGVPVSPYRKWTGIRAEGNTGKSAKGRVTATFPIGGSYFFTSRVTGECDAKWLRINVG